VRESPALKIIGLLAGLGADLVYHDAHVPALADYGLESVGLDEALEGADLAVVVTAHRGLDYEGLAARVPCLVDLRGATRARGLANVQRL
jgi:UDP-N-acetyl-D-glucosamine dehydrogenase